MGFDFGRELAGRVACVRASMESKGFHALYVSNPKNVCYLTGREAGRLLLTPKEAFLWVRDLYTGVYRSLYGCRDYPFEVRVYDEGVVSREVKRLRCRRIAVENVNYSYFGRLRRSFGCRLIATGIVEDARAVKTPYELMMLRKAASIAKSGMEEAVRVVREGVRELDAVAAIESRIRTLGSETPPFHDGMLLASGRRGADIHAHATKSRIRRGLVVVDLGARCGGYYSDMTRTLPVGRLNRRESDMLEFVKGMQEEAISRIQPGVKGSEVQSFIEAELGKKKLKFYHSAGHGIGLEVHEKPSLGPDSLDVLSEGMVFTVEPGVYMPGSFGVRFEDTLLLTKKGCVALTR